VQGREDRNAGKRLPDRSMSQVQPHPAALGRYAGAAIWRIEMTIGIGRRRLVVTFIVDQGITLTNRFPAAELATDKELARMESRRMARHDRLRWESAAALYGVGYPR
jgi:hypothetical protein